MFHGEEMTKTASASGVLPQGYGNGLAGPSERVIRTAPTIGTLVGMAIETQKLAADRAMSLDALSSRALDIATRLTGSFPAPDPGPRVGSAGERVEDPSSALDVVQREIGGIRGPLSAMDGYFDRLAVALDAIERAIG